MVEKALTPYVWPPSPLVSLAAAVCCEFTHTWLLGSKSKVTDVPSLRVAMRLSSSPLNWEVQALPVWMEMYLTGWAA